MLKDYIIYRESNSQWPQALSIIVGFFTFGAQLVWISPATPILTSDASPIGKISMEEVSYMVVIPQIIWVISTALLATVLGTTGRKTIMALLAVPQLLSWMLIAFARNLYVIYASQLLTGIANTITFAVLPIYVAEISEPHVRGFWGTFPTISAYAGYCTVNVVGAVLTIRDGALFFVGIVVIYFIAALYVPESPYYLLTKQREAEAEAALQKLRWRLNVAEELMQLKNDVNRQMSESATWIDLYSNPINRRALCVSVTMRFLQLFSGFVAFATYSQYMFEKSNGNLSAFLSAIIYNAVITVVESFFAFTVDKYGRRTLMIFSCVSCSVILVLEATYFYIDERTNLSTVNVNWLPLTGLLIYLVVFSAGLGILPTLMLGELFSASIKSKAICVSNLFFALFLLSASKLFEYFTDTFGMYLPFYIFAFCCFCGAIFSYYFVPETKGKTLEEIQQSLMTARNINDISSSII